MSLAANTFYTVITMLSFSNNDALSCNPEREGEGWLSLGVYAKNWPLEDEDTNLVLNK